MSLSISSAPHAEVAGTSKPTDAVQSATSAAKRSQTGHLPNPLLPKTLFKPQDCLQRKLRQSNLLADRAG